MDYERALDEIKRLRDYHEGQINYINICKILKEMVLIPRKITDKKEVLIYILSQLITIVETKPGTDINDDIKHGQDMLKSIAEQTDEKDEYQKNVNNVIAEMYSIVLFDNKNEMNILKFLYMLYTDRPLTPLTDDLDEWEIIGKYDVFNIYKSKRCDKVFMDERTGKVTYTEGKIFITNDGKYVINEDSTVELKLPTMLPQTEYINL